MNYRDQSIRISDPGAGWMGDENRTGDGQSHLELESDLAGKEHQYSEVQPGEHTMGWEDLKQVNKIHIVLGFLSRSTGEE